LLDLNTKELTELDIPSNNSVVDLLPKIGLSINDNGQVAGYVLDEHLFSEAFITGFDGIGTTKLAGLSERYDFTLPSDINNTGQVVGESPNNEGIRRAFITGPDGMGMRDLGTLDGGIYSFAYGINNAAQVVGQSQVIRDVVRDAHAFITGPDGVGMRDLGGGTSVAYDINDSGQAAGFFSSHTFITGPDGVGMAWITPLNYIPNDEIVILQGEEVPPSINNSGQVAGSSFVLHSTERFKVFISHAFVTGPNGRDVTDLGTLGGSESHATGINDAGQVIGSAETSAGINHAFITGLNGNGMIDLNSLVDLPQGVILTEAMDINNKGQVAVIAIPEPHSYAMLLAGLSVLYALSRRRKILQ
jgi:probable HAF family extracellular repeat protein